MKELDPLLQQLQYQFKAISLLRTALTHCSVNGIDNERLEFLGDSIVNFVIAEALYSKFPEAKEGQLSRLRARLVCGETLADLAREMGLSDYLRLGRGELKSGGHLRASILADAVEAIVAAIYIDGGMVASESFVLRIYAERLANANLKQSSKDPKTKLQEYLQANHFPLPVYQVNAVEGHAHQQTFSIFCAVEGIEFTAEGVGTSRRKAEQKAAEAFLTKLTTEKTDTMKNE